jgi:chaperonin GroES
MSYTEVKPLNGNVFVLCRKDNSVGGIILPDSAQEKPFKGEVTHVPNMPKDQDPLEFAVGNVVFFSKWDAKEIDFLEKSKDQQYFAVPCDKILGYSKK